MQRASLYETETINNVLVIGFQDESVLDAGGEDALRSDLEQLIAPTRVPRIALDISIARHLCSSTMGMLIALQKQFRDENRTLELCSPQPNVRSALEVSMLHKLFPIHDSVESATVE